VVVGCTGVLCPERVPFASIAPLAITSFSFMLVWVPEPVARRARGISPRGRHWPLPRPRARWLRFAQGRSRPMADIPPPAQPPLSLANASARSPPARFAIAKEMVERWRLLRPVVAGWHLDRHEAVGFDPLLAGWRLPISRRDHFAVEFVESCG